MKFFFNNAVRGWNFISEEQIEITINKMNKNYFLTSFMFKNKMYPYEQFSRSMAWFIFTGLFTIYTSLAAY